MLACPEMASLNPRVALLATLAVSCVTGLSLPASGSATTGIEQTLPVQVTMTDAGVRFSERFQATTDLTLQMRITNKSAKRRWFRIGNRQTHALRKGQTEFVYFSFYIPGKVAWKSRATGGKPFGGIFNVKPADRFGIPQG
jgi:hypothetical protein